MQDYRININYAKALFTLAGETNQQEEVAKDMRLVQELCAENHVLAVVFSNPIIKEDKKVGILRDLLGERVSRLTDAFLTFVVKKRRSVNLKGISSAYLELFRDSRGIVLSTLTTAVEADEGLKETVRGTIGKYTGRTVELNTAIDPKALGGFAMSFDNKMYDARISTMLEKLHREFDRNDYESKL